MNFYENILLSKCWGIQGLVQSKVDGPEIQKWRYLGMKAEEIHTFEQEIVIFILQLYLHRVYHNQSDVDSNEKDRIRFVKDCIVYVKDKQIPDKKI